MRQANYDYLRILAAIAVIMIHVSATWVGRYTDAFAEAGRAAGTDTVVSSDISVNATNALKAAAAVDFSEVGTVAEAFAGGLGGVLITCLYNTISRFAVPCFIMLSGAFLLSDERTREYRSFYRRRLKKIFVPTFVFSVLYILYSLPFCFVGDDRGMHEVLSLAKSVVRGEPFYHMWYLYMLLVLYLLAPWAMRVKESLDEATYRRMALVFLVLASLSRWTSSVVLNWDFGQAFEYLGYFYVGDVLREELSIRNRFGSHRNGKGALLIAAGFLVEAGTAYLEYRIQVLTGIGEGGLKYKIVSPYCPTIVLASVLIFAGFSALTVKESHIITRLAGLSFFIYLFHAGVWDVLQKGIRYGMGSDFFQRAMYPGLWIPVCVAGVFGVSLALAWGYERVGDRRGS